MIVAESEGASRQLFLVAPDFRSERPLASKRLGVGPMGQVQMGQLGSGAGPMGFSRDGRKVSACTEAPAGTAPSGSCGALTLRPAASGCWSNVDLPVFADALRGFSLHPDGTRFLTAVSAFPYDIWMLEGFDRP